MKNRIILSIVSTLLLIALVISACSNKNNDEQTVENVSYIQSALYVGNSADYNVTLTQGVGEKLFIADGKTQEVEDFIKLTVTPTSSDLLNVELSYKLVGEKGEISDVLQKDAFGAYFAAEPDVDTIGKPIGIIITNGKNQTEISLTDMINGKTSNRAALEKAKDALSDRLSGDNKSREIYVRLINNSQDPKSPYYWYVAFIAAPTDYYSALVDLESGELVSTNPRQENLSN